MRVPMDKTFSIPALERSFQIRFSLATDVKLLWKGIAGLLARRIVFWKRAGDKLARGERVGLIKFGSRVDLLVEAGVEIRVKVGDHIHAGSDIIGYSRPKA